jgi:hypothetical protein
MLRSGLRKLYHFPLLPVGGWLQGYQFAALLVSCVSLWTVLQKLEATDCSPCLLCYYGAMVAYWMSLRRAAGKSQGQDNAGRTYVGEDGSGSKSVAYRLHGSTKKSLVWVAESLRIRPRQWKRALKRRLNVKLNLEAELTNNARHTSCKRLHHDHHSRLRRSKSLGAWKVPKDRNSPMKIEEVKFTTTGKATKNPALVQLYPQG